jgi:hypothetical protein
MIKCRWKGCVETDQSKVELHHVVPKCWGGTDRNGRAYLCKEHHDKLHEIIAPYVIELTRQYLE